MGKCFYEVFQWCYIKCQDTYIYICIHTNAYMHTFSRELKKACLSMGRPKHIEGFLE